MFRGNLNGFITSYSAGVSPKLNTDFPINYCHIKNTTQVLLYRRPIATTFITRKSNFYNVTLI